MGIHGFMGTRHFLCIVWMGIGLAWAGSGLADAFSEAESRLQAGDMDGAMEKIEQLLDDQPGHVEARMLRGIILVEQGHLEQARISFESLVADHPELPQPYNNLAAIYAATGRMDRAREALRRALDIAPDYGVAQENLGDLYVTMAVEHYARARKGVTGRAHDKAAGLRDFKQRFGIDLTGGETLPATQEEPPGPVQDQPDGVPSQVAGREEGAAVVPAEDGDTAGGGTDEERSVASCLLIGPFQNKDLLAQITRRLKDRAVAVRRVDRVTPYEVYWVYIPPLESRAAAQARLRELRAKGLKDVRLVHKGEFANGISLGSYSRLDSVRRRMKQLKARGIDSVFKLSESRKSMTWLMAGSVSQVEIGRLKEAYPDLKLEIGACQHGN